jgi:hypothetical protein
MSSTLIEVSATVSASADRIYRILSDYRQGHPETLPRRILSRYRVEQGGVGEGTVISFELTAFARRQRFRARVAEPEPGLVMTETVEGSGHVTVFHLEPLTAVSTRVTIASRLRPSPRRLSALRARLAALWLGRVYRRQLRLLAAIATGGGISTAPARDAGRSVRSGAGRDPTRRFLLDPVGFARFAEAP